MHDPPRVFENESLTLVLNKDNCRLYFGSNEVCLSKQVNVSTSKEGNKIEIIFPFASNEEENLKIEENMRIIRAITWIEVKIG
jgi:hypothetical protein